MGRWITATSGEDQVLLKTAYNDILSQSLYNFAAKEYISFPIKEEPNTVDDMPHSDNSFYYIANAWGELRLYDVINRALCLAEQSSINKSLIWDSAHGLYDVSYFQLNNPNSNANAIMLLITSLKMLFLEKNDTRNKKDMLSKRVATYIAISDDERIIIYNEMKLLYKLRSDYVHDGKFDVSVERVRKLRGFVRRSLLKYEYETKSKKQMIENIKKEIVNEGYFQNL